MVISVLMTIYVLCLVSSCEMGSLLTVRVNKAFLFSGIRGNFTSLKEAGIITNSSCAVYTCNS